jgi:hypothetical protein
LIYLKLISPLERSSFPNENGEDEEIDAAAAFGTMPGEAKGQINFIFLV